MIGWFSLNVPAALCLYWVTNNIVTTATSVIIKNSVKMEPALVGDVAAAAPPTKSTVFAPPPMREKPSGFSAPVSQDGLKPITAIDAEIVAKVSEEGESASEQPAPKKKVS
jgi:YidC/Oxa1 family membrane protein insertase